MTTISNPHNGTTKQNMRAPALKWNCKKNVFDSCKQERTNTKQTLFRGQTSTRKCKMRFPKHMSTHTNISTHTYAGRRRTHT